MPDRDALAALVGKAHRGQLSAAEQRSLAAELLIYRRAALRLERAVHRLVKRLEKGGIL